MAQATTPNKVMFYNLSGDEPVEAGSLTASDKFQNITADGRLASSVLEAAKRRLWTNEQIMQYYSSWTNGYTSSKAQ